MARRFQVSGRLLRQSGTQEDGNRSTSRSGGLPSRRALATLAGVLLTAWFLPALSHQWQDRQRAREVQASFVHENRPSDNGRDHHESSARSRAAATHEDRRLRPGHVQSTRPRMAAGARGDRGADRGVLPELGPARSLAFLRRLRAQRVLADDQSLLRARRHRRPHRTTRSEGAARRRGDTAEPIHDSGRPSVLQVSAASEPAVPPRRAYYSASREC